MHRVIAALIASTLSCLAWGEVPAGGAEKGWVARSNS